MDEHKSDENHKSHEGKSHESHKSHEGKSHGEEFLVRKRSHSRGITNKIRENPWILSTFVLGVVLLIFLVANFVGFNGLSGNVLSEKQVGEKVIGFLNGQTGGGVEYVSAVKKYGLYEVTVSYEDKDIPVYATQDGKYFIQGVSEMIAPSDSSPTTPQEVPKSDKPKVELYVFTYCPYGTQSEKGIIPAVKLLSNKIDFKIRQIGAMHGEYEKIEAQRQLCVEKEYPTKFLDYVLDFALSSEIGACGTNLTCAAPKINALYTKLGINKAKMETCMKGDGVSLYAVEEQNAKSQGVSGSPTLVINGKQIQSARDSASYLKTICSAFNIAPSECEEQLSSAAPSPGFGASTGASSSAAQC